LPCGGWLTRDACVRLNREGEPEEGAGAMSAIALLVSPVKPRVACICVLFDLP